MDANRKKSIVTIMGKAILFASMQFAIGSVEMSSKFSVKNFSKDQVTLQHAADALSDYIFIGVVCGAESDVAVAPHGGDRFDHMAVRKGLLAHRDP